ncbi:antibiotic biosynthesis monooxygenase family protein [Kordiimonas marina]|uniref:antibiotic biosynthesis monooxygenase family protein n=1 Tax=Kordiimonas marina TaxID=2872312 RepID=UPI001FF1F230|nr:antibiotic biosynthesis monooxygenase [Kordiimonas marina]MCJ9428389.1 antibiotic biosynthesis monooxygenase [Kordiimonas marina]
MIAVLFAVELAQGRKEDYLRIAAELKAQLDTLDGFLSVERFQSLSTPSKLLSLSFFENEAAVQAWRNIAEHRQAQAAGRLGIFTDYRLRIASIIRDYGMHDRAGAPEDSKDAHP